MVLLTDFVGNTLSVTDIQVGATTPGVGLTGTSVSTYMAGASSATSIAGVLTVLNTATAGAATKAIQIGTGATSSLGVYFGTGAPTTSAAQGSLYLNVAGSSVSSRAYINTTGVSTWTAITTLA